MRIAAAPHSWDKPHAPASRSGRRTRASEPAVRLGNSWLARVQGDNVLVIRPALAAARWAAFVALAACSFTPSSPAPVERMPPVPHTCHFPPNVALALAVHTSASERRFGQALRQEPDAPGIAYVTAGQIELPGRASVLGACASSLTAPRAEWRSSASPKIGNRPGSAEPRVARSMLRIVAPPRTDRTSRKRWRV